MQSQKEDQIVLLQRISLAVLHAVDAADELGAPSGVLYAALQSHGATLNQFQSFMSGLTGKGMLTLDGQCYRITESGKAFRDILERKFQSAPAADSLQMKG